jgi:hypothetical protein
VDLALVWSEFSQHAPQAQRVFAERRPHPVIARSCGIALIEDEVEDFQHGRESRRQLVAARHLEWHLRLKKGPFGADDTLGDRGCGDEKGPRDLLGRQPPDHA